MAVTYAQLKQYPEITRMHVTNRAKNELTVYFDTKHLELIKSNTWTLNKNNIIVSGKNIPIATVIKNINYPDQLLVFRNNNANDIREKNFITFKRNTYILGESESILEIRSYTNPVAPIIVMFSTVDYDVICSHTWRIDKDGYIITTLVTKSRINPSIPMHIHILGRRGIKDGKIIDHIDRNRMNNTRENLRLTTHSINNRNRVCTNLHSQTGVNRGKYGWHASWPDPNRPGKRVYRFFSINKLGEEEAKRQAIEARREFERQSVGFLHSDKHQ